MNNNVKLSLTLPMIGFVILFLLSILMCGAQSGPTTGVVPVSVTVRGVDLGAADFERGGQVSMKECELGLEIPLCPTTGTLGRLSFRTGVVDVDTPGAVGRVAEMELDPLLTTSVGYFLTVPGAGGWSRFFRGGIMASGESGAKTEDSLLYNGMGGAEYTISKNLSLQMGLLGTTRLEENPLVLPLVGFRWRPAPGWMVATEGPGLTISGPVRRDLKFTLNAGWMTRAWRLDADAPAPAGVLETEAIRLETGLRWKPGHAWQFEARVGWEPSRTYRLLDDDGHDSGIVTSESAPLADLSATYRF
jgi:hypothetical protein